jgi:methylenetetrahydrofolate dehydrogenase (NADP+)/methenyltetrahydrofolate cyclohydrolase
MKALSGSELAGYIKERQSKEVRRLKQAHKIFPALAIIQDHPDPVIDTYVRLKERYGRDIGVAVERFLVRQDELESIIQRLNDDEKFHGIIVQLPLGSPERTDDIVEALKPDKDVDGLGPDAEHQSATAQAIFWLLAGYGIELAGRVVAVVGQGRLVGGPLIKQLKASGIEPLVFDETNANLAGLKQADVIISAAGQPGLITPDLVKEGATVIDAGTSSEGGVLKGDASDELYERSDISLTPKRGGVGPLTVASLFDNLLRAARARMAAP